MAYKELLNPLAVKNDDTLTLYVPFDMRPFQKEFLENSGRFNILFAHRRFGKSVVLLLKLFLSFMTCKKKNPRFWYVAPTLNSAVDILWRYSKDMFGNVPGVVIKESDYSIAVDLGDGIGERLFRIVGANNEEGGNKRGVYLDGVVIDEMGDMRRGVWESAIAPMLAERHGWAVLTGTPALGYWKEIFEGARVSDTWKVFDYGDARRTQVLSEQELYEMKNVINDDVKFRREFYGEWLSPDLGSYYLPNMIDLNDKGYISETVQYDPNLPVITSWDLGTNDFTVVWFAQYDPIRDTLSFIDFYQKRGASSDMEMLKEVENKRYPIDLIVLPHDSLNRSVNSKFNTYQIFSRLYPTIRLQKTGRVLSDIEIIKNQFSNFRFNSTNCSIGIQELYNYKSKFNSKQDKLSTTPEHSDIADSFRYMVIGLQTARYKYTMFNERAKVRQSSEIKIIDLL